MYKYLYVSTDEAEALALVDPRAVRYKFTNIDPQTGAELSKRIGFNPMCSIEIDDCITSEDIERIVGVLVKEGLYVAFESGDGVKPYKPQYNSLRELLIMQSLRTKDPLPQELQYFSNRPGEFLELFSEDVKKLFE